MIFVYTFYLCLPTSEITQWSHFSNSMAGISEPLMCGIQERGKQGGWFGIRPHDFFSFLQLLLNQDWLLRLLYYPGLLNPQDGIRSVCSLSVQTSSSHSQSLLHDCIFYLMRLQRSIKVDINKKSTIGGTLTNHLPSIVGLTLIQDELVILCYSPINKSLICSQLTWNVT